jgi:hypothetical protein
MKDIDTMMSPSMTGQLEALEPMAKATGLTLTATEPGRDFVGTTTSRTIAALTADPSKNFVIELSEGFDVSHAKFANELKAFLEESALRLKNPVPNFYYSLLGFPLTFGSYAWPAHASTSGADTFVVHGEIRLATGEDSPLHAKVSAALTQTFKDVVPALEQPFAESFIYNAVRKTLDQGQLEMVKSGNRQPVPVTTRYYSARQQKFIFNDTNEEQRREFLKGKVYWLSAVLGAGQPVWVADPRDAQYLNTNVEELKKNAATLASEGVVELSAAGEWAAATDKLREFTAHFEGELADGLAFIKPSFNEEMRSGQTNM